MTDWQTKTIYYQFGNIGAEIGRALKWKDHDDKKATSAAERALDSLIGHWPIDATPPTSKKSLVSERYLPILFWGVNQYNQSMASWGAYFLPYSLAAH